MATVTKILLQSWGRHSSGSPATVIWADCEVARGTRGGNCGSEASPGAVPAREQERHGRAPGLLEHVVGRHQQQGGVPGPDPEDDRGQHLRHLRGDQQQALRIGLGRRLPEMRRMLTVGQMGHMRGPSTMAAPRKYPLELPDRAVRMYHTADPKPQIKRLAVDLGVRPEALRGWIRQAEADVGGRDDRLTAHERAELAALHKENAQLKRANDVLRPASAFSRRNSTRPGPGDGAHRRAPPPGSRVRTSGTAHPLLHLLPPAPSRATAVRTTAPGRPAD
ncbi:transposase [Streptomyces sp. NPDC023838]|uniref:transposase n=1 Tax=Streptomyces sp. NPDC023838 TaxID=3154325 RepID=UPI0033E5534F